MQRQNQPLIILPPPNSVLIVDRHGMSSSQEVEALSPRRELRAAVGGAEEVDPSHATCAGIAMSGLD